jgi:hypothetical protein
VIDNCLVLLLLIFDELNLSRKLILKNYLKRNTNLRFYLARRLSACGTFVRAKFRYSRRKRLGNAKLKSDSAVLTSVEYAYICFAVSLLAFSETQII